ncbi:MAG: hypothetical protein ABFD82_05350 [Syntrophaceae bacterium]
MNIKISHIILVAFCLAVSILYFLTLAHYPGRAAAYAIFTISLNALFVIGFTKGRIFFDTFIGIFFWLGFWLKFSVRVAFMGGNFHEPVGNFNGTGTAFDSALLVTSCGVIGLLLASFVRRKFPFSYEKASSQIQSEKTFSFYQRYRVSALVLFFVLFVIVAVTNATFGIYQRGTVSRTILPFGFGGIYAWLLLFGFASFSAVILDCEFRLKKNPYLASIIALLECFSSNVSMLSRGMILNSGALMLGAHEKTKRCFMDPSLLYKLTMCFVLAALFISSIFVTSHVRSYIYSVSGTKVVTHDTLAHTAKVGQVLMLDRWVGIEGVMAVSSYPGLGWDLWKKAWLERFSRSGTSMYDLTFIVSPYVEMDKSINHFVSVPGILAFFYYPGSYVFLFVSMLFLGFLGAGIEVFVYKLGGANIILCSLLAQIVAYRYAHFGYAPNQSYLLFGSILLNVLIIYFFNKFLLRINKAEGHGCQSGTYTS